MSRSTDRLRLPSREFGSFFKLVPEDRSFNPVPKDEAQLAQRWIVSAPLDDERCLLAEPTWSTFGPNEHILGAGVAPLETIGDDARWRDLLRGVWIDSDRAVVASPLAVFLIHRGQAFLDDDRHRFIPDELLSASAEAPEDQSWTVIDIESHAVDDRVNLTLLVRIADSRRRPVESSILRTYVDSDGFGPITTATRTLEVIGQIVVDADGRTFAAGWDSFLLLSESFDAPFRQMELGSGGENFQVAESVSVPEGPHLIATEGGAIFIGDLFAAPPTPIMIRTAPAPITHVVERNRLDGTTELFLFEYPQRLYRRLAAGQWLPWPYDLPGSASQCSAEPDECGRRAVNRPRTRFVQTPAGTLVTLGFGCSVGFELEPESGCAEPFGPDGATPMRAEETFLRSVVVQGERALAVGVDGLVYEVAWK